MELSSELMDKLWGDDAILAELEDLHESYASGNRAALMDAVMVCGLSQAVMPDWMVDALSEIHQCLTTGEFKDLNEAFGWTSPHKGTQRKIVRQRKFASEILARLQQHRLSGGSMNAEEAFQPIADELGIPRQDVEAVYKNEGQFVKSLPKEAAQSEIHGFMRMSLTQPRRTGRPIFKDHEG